MSEHRSRHSRQQAQHGAPCQGTTAGTAWCTHHSRHSRHNRHSRQGMPCQGTTAAGCRGRRPAAACRTHQRRCVQGERASANEHMAVPGGSAWGGASAPAQHEPSCSSFAHMHATRWRSPADRVLPHLKLCSTVTGIPMVAQVSPCKTSKKTGNICAAMRGEHAHAERRPSQGSEAAARADAWASIQERQHPWPQLNRTGRAAGAPEDSTCCVASCFTRTEANSDMAEGGSRQESAQPGPPYGWSDGIK